MASQAATGSTPSLYQDDLPSCTGPVSALMPEALRALEVVPPPQCAPLLATFAAGPLTGSNGWSPSKGPAAAAAAAAARSPAAGKPRGLGPAAAASSGRAGDALAEPAGAGAGATPPPVVPPLPPSLRPSAERVGPVPISSGSEAGSAGSGRGSLGSEGRRQHQSDDRQPTLGTWAARQFKLLLPGSGKEQQQQLPQRKPGPACPWPAGDPSGPLEREPRQQAHAAATSLLSTSLAQPIPGVRQPAARGPDGAAMARHAGTGGVPSQEEGEDDDETLARAAWRWRFAKRWQAEQVRQLDPAASGGDGDGMDEALAYLAACGQPWEMSRTVSDGMGGSSGSAPRTLGTLDNVGLLGQEQMLVGDMMSHPASLAGGSPACHLGSAGGSGHGGGAAMLRPSAGGRGCGRHAAGAATRELTAATRRAKQLLKAHADLDRAAGERWREAEAPPGSELWVGALLESVEVDDWGKFKFVLVRVRDHAGRQKLIVRGRNYASEGKLLEALHRQLLATAASHGVPSEPLETVGGGVMEWRRDRDRHLHLHSGYASPPGACGPNGPMSPAEVLNLVGVLTKQSLPITYKVTTECGKVL